VGTTKTAQPMSTTIRKSSSNSKRPSAVWGLPYDAERVMQLRSMLREARKQKLSAGLRARREKGSR
jgi:hypothetical protein